MTSSQACAPSPQKHNMKNFFRQTISSAERHAIKQHLIDSEAEFGRIQAEIDRLKARIAVLDFRGGSLKESMAKYRSLLSPIHRMPPEILLQIFGFCCEAKPIGMSGDPDPIGLSKVCGRWRDIIGSTPRFWTSIWFDLSAWCAGGNMQRLKQLARAYVERSKAAPVSLQLDVDSIESEPPTPQEELDEAIVAIGCLFGISGRWRHLHCDHRLLNLAPFQSLSNHLPSLERLVVVSEAKDWCDSPVIDCPSLTSLEVKANCWIEEDFPLHQIRSLSLCGSHTIPALDILRPCTRLNRLELHCVGGFNTDEGPETQEHAILPHVRHMIVSAGNEEDVTTMFDTFTLSSLSEIEVRREENATNDWNSWDLSPLKNLLLRSSCAITSLSLDSVPLTDAETTSLLRLMPALAKLSIVERTENAPENRIITPALLKFLTAFDVNEISRPFLTSLKHLTLSMHYAWGSRQALVGVVVSRASDAQDTAATSTTRLQSFSLTLMAKVKEKVDVAAFTAPLKCFRNAGLLMNISLKKI